MSRVAVPMPQMGASVTEGTISRWLKAPGDAVQEGEALVEISTDKVDAEVPAPTSGMLMEILVQEGDTVLVETAIATLETAESGTDAPAMASPAKAKAEPEAGAVMQTPPASAPSAVAVGPAVAELLAEHGLEADHIPRQHSETLTATDVAAFLAQPQRLPAPLIVTDAPSSSAPVPTVEVPEPAAATVSAAAVTTAFSPSKMAGAVQIWQVDCGQLEDADALLVDVVRATLGAIAEFPQANASSERQVQLGVEVDNTLVVIERAETLNLLGLRQALGGTSSDGDATFTIWHPGRLGALIAIPALPVGHTAALAIGAVLSQPTVQHDHDGTPLIAVRPIVQLALVFDPQRLDTPSATQFMATITRQLRHEHRT